MREYLKEHKEIAHEIEQKIRSIVGIVDQARPAKKAEKEKTEKEKEK